MCIEKVLSNVKCGKNWFVDIAKIGAYSNLLGENLPWKWKFKLKLILPEAKVKF